MVFCILLCQLRYRSEKKASVVLEYVRGSISVSRNAQRGGGAGEKAEVLSQQSDWCFFLNTKKDR